MLSDQRRPFGPGPGASPVQVRVPCRMTMNRRVAPDRHHVTIHADWSVDTPHDLYAERIGVALGGHSSCVGLVDHAIPALREWVGLMLRVRPIPLLAVSACGWALGEPAPCCQARTFDGAADAAIHARSIPHLAARFEADWDVVTSLAAASSRAYGTAFELCIRGEVFWRACAAVRGGFPDAAYLWNAGLSPAVVAEIHRRSGATRALPRACYTAVAAGVLDPDELDSSHRILAMADAGATDTNWMTYLRATTYGEEQ